MEWMRGTGRVLSGEVVLDEGCEDVDVVWKDMISGVVGVERVLCGG